jgi:hypothetical protein
LANWSFFRNLPGGFSWRTRITRSLDSCDFSFLPLLEYSIAAL